MTLSAAQFLAPLGDIEADTMFPGEADSVVRTRLETYIAEGYAKSSALDASVWDFAVSAWVYHRAYKAVFISLSATPSSNAMADQGSTLYTQAQISNFNELSKEALADFNNILSSGIITQRPQSYSVSHKVTYR
jgi:hypothetical protein